MTALVLAGCLYAAPAQAEDVVRVGVVVSLTVNVDEPAARSIADDLGDALAQELAVDAVAGAEAERRLPTEGLDNDCLAKPACLKDVGARLEADQLLMLVILRVGEAIQIDPTWVDAATGRARSRDAVRLDTSAERTAVLRAAAPKLLPGVMRRSTTVAAAAVVTPKPDGAPIRWPVYAAAGVSAVLLVGGITFGLAASTDESSLASDGCDVMACDPSRVDSLETKALVADLLYVGSALSAAAAVVLYIVTGDPTPSSTVAIEATSDSASAAWRVRF